MDTLRARAKDARDGADAAQAAVDAAQTELDADPYLPLGLVPPGHIRANLRVVLEQIAGYIGELLAGDAFDLPAFPSLGPQWETISRDAQCAKEVRQAKEAALEAARQALDAAQGRRDAFAAELRDGVRGLLADLGLGGGNEEGVDAFADAETDSAASGGSSVAASPETASTSQAARMARAPRAASSSHGPAVFKAIVTASGQLHDCVIAKYYDVLSADDRARAAVEPWAVLKDARMPSGQRCTDRPDVWAAQTCDACATAESRRSHSCSLRYATKAILVLAGVNRARATRSPPDPPLLWRVEVADGRPRLHVEDAHP